MDPNSRAFLGSMWTLLLEEGEEEEEVVAEAVGRIFLFFDLLSTTIPFVISSFAFIFIMTTKRAREMSGIYL